MELEVIAVSHSDELTTSLISRIIKSKNLTKIPMRELLITVGSASWKEGRSKL